MTTTAVLHAPDISCGHCKAHIEGDLTGEPGIEKVEVDVETKDVHVTFDEQGTDLDAVQAKLAEIGYPVG
ncbi:MAG: heavy-metal-associated domain-containing protein [Acidimicrobiales bacterium]|jgi:copper chaperone